MLAFTFTHVQVVNIFAADADGGGAHREHRGGETGEADDHVLLFCVLSTVFPVSGRVISSFLDSL